MNRTLPINRMQQYFKEQQRANHAAAKQVEPLSHVGGMGGNHNSGDEPFFPQTARYECPPNPDGRRLRKYADNEYRSEPTQQCVWGIGDLLLAVLVVGTGALFWKLIVCMVARILGALH